MFIALMVWILVVSVIACHVIAKRRGANPVFWGLLGALFGPLAIPFAFLAKKKE